jgi:hypothetical protein
MSKLTAVDVLGIFVLLGTLIFLALGVRDICCVPHTGY